MRSQVRQRPAGDRSHQAENQGVQARQGRRTSQGRPAAHARQPSGIYDRGERSGVGDSLQKTFFLHDLLKPNFNKYLF